MRLLAADAKVSFFPFQVKQEKQLSDAAAFRSGARESRNQPDLTEL